MPDLIALDGNYLEGGGQILRTALALSTLLQKPFSITEIRKGRKKPGLKNQHLFCIKALESLANAKAEGASLGSSALKFYPNEIKPQTLSVDIETAGSITLLLQSLLPVCILGGGENLGKFRLKIKGGTDTKWSMPVDYLKNVFVPQMKKYADINVSLIKRGYYPKGNGLVDIKIKGKYNMKTFNEAPQIDLVEQGKLVQIKGVSHAARFLENQAVAERQAKAAKLLLGKLNVPISIDVQYCDTLSPGSAIIVWAIFSKQSSQSEEDEEIDFLNPVILGADGLGEPGKRSEDVGQEAAEKLLAQINSGAACDEHMEDNLIPYLGFFGGKIKVAKMTNHTKTNIYTTEQFIDKKFRVDEVKNVISVD